MKSYSLFVLLIFSSIAGFAQQQKWSAGLYSHMEMESPHYDFSIGVQGKYDFALRHAAQAQVSLGSNATFLEASYLFSFLDRTKSNFNVFAGAGVGHYFYSFNSSFYVNNEVVTAEISDNTILLSGQLGISYYIPKIKTSIYTGYKAYYDVDYDQLAPNYLMLGVRYHF
ncbi:hypothetical protein [Sphingobacterium hungaricum]|uniref:Outer membrane protein beta-barrel domain-containing protein n=1 Tax=Sphingobacterium hungaricum TaxID=2082723 RepID=A0A928UYC6_9SPHI|nr:hypothetical protein [Sphingobacterium hungaricum]MBE8715501.1 hypothetical protein [Sphingobacterium hungaricum]